MCTNLGNIKVVEFKGMTEKPPTHTEEAEKQLLEAIDKDIEIYKKAIDICINDELREMLKDSLIELQEKRIDKDGVQ